MIDPSEITDALVEKLRDIKDLVDGLGGDEEKLFAYHDRYPKSVSLEAARYAMLSPGIMVAYQGTFPGSLGGFETWRHEFSITIRAQEEAAPIEPEPDPVPLMNYYQLFREIVKGVPAGTSIPMINATVHASCQPMDTPSMRRQTDGAGVDYFEVSMSFTEIGDD